MVDPNTFSPATMAAPDPRPLLVDLATEGLMVLDRAKDAAVDSIRAVPPEPTADSFVTISNVNGDGTNYVFGPQILDLADYRSITVLPRVTNAGTVAATVYWKFQWSLDGTNWIEDFIDSTMVNGDVYAAAGAPAAGERLIGSTGYLVRSFTVAAGYKGAILGAVALAVPVKARYLRIGQKMNAAVTGTETVEYHFQLA